MKKEWWLELILTAILFTVKLFTLISNISEVSDFLSSLVLPELQMPENYNRQSNEFNRQNFVGCFPLIYSLLQLLGNNQLIVYNYSFSYSCIVITIYPIIWGDYASEKGILTGAHSGLILNTKPIIPDNYKETYPLKIDKLGTDFRH